LSAVLAFHTYNPDVPLKYTEQSGLEKVMLLEEFRDSVVYMPQRWFNAFPTGRRKDAAHKAGDLLIHFASNRDGSRLDRMTKWMDIIDQHLPEWEVPLEQSSLPGDVRKFWEMEAAERKEKEEKTDKEGKGLKKERSD